jgi:hypothetical protein
MLDHRILEPSEKVDHIQGCTRYLERTLIQEEMSGAV